MDTLIIALRAAALDALAAAGTAQDNGQRLRLHALSNTLKAEARALSREVVTPAVAA